MKNQLTQEGIQEARRIISEILSAYENRTNESEFVCINLMNYDMGVPLSGLTYQTCWTIRQRIRQYIRQFGCIEELLAADMKGVQSADDLEWDDHDVDPEDAHSFRIVMLKDFLKELE